MSFLEQQLALVSLGGPVVIILMVMSIFGLAIFFFKLLEFTQFSSANFGKLEALLVSRDRRDTLSTLDQLDKQGGPLPLVLQQAIQWQSRGNYDENLVREELQLRGKEVLVKVNRLLGFLEQIVLLAPLLGLLGTVLGIIDVFQNIAVSDIGGETASLAGGIWEALLTTAVGMAVAIPFSIMHWYLSDRAGGIAVRIEGLFTQLFTAELYK